MFHSALKFCWLKITSPLFSFFKLPFKISIFISIYYKSYLSVTVMKEFTYHFWIICCAIVRTACQIWGALCNIKTTHTALLYSIYYSSILKPIKSCSMLKKDILSFSHADLDSLKKSEILLFLICSRPCFIKTSIFLKYIWGVNLSLFNKPGNSLF